jgi:hypothetical protein
VSIHGRQFANSAKLEASHSSQGQKSAGNTIPRYKRSPGPHEKTACQRGENEVGGGGEEQELNNRGAQQVREMVSGGKER